MCNVNVFFDSKDKLRGAYVDVASPDDVGIDAVLNQALEVDDGVQRIVNRLRRVTIAVWQKDGNGEWYRKYVMPKHLRPAADNSIHEHIPIDDWKEKLDELGPGCAMIVRQSLNNAGFRSSVTSYCSSLWGAARGQQRKYATHIKDDGSIEVYRFSEA